MIIWLPLSAVFLINAIMLGSEEPAKWFPALAFLFFSILFLIAYIKELEGNPPPDL